MIMTLPGNIRYYLVNRSILNKTLQEEALMGLTTQYHPFSLIRKDLAGRGYITGKALRFRVNGSKVKVAGKVILIHTPPTKSGIRVMFVTLEDETGLIDLAVFPKAQERYARTIKSSKAILVIGRLRRMGARDISVVADHVYPIMEFHFPPSVTL